MKDLVEEKIKNIIHNIRGKQVILDMDLARLYNVETKRLNEQVKRNIERFPENFMFQLTEAEKEKLVAFCDHLKNLKFSSQRPYVFTEQGVAMLSGILRSETAIKVSIQIMGTFVTMRKFISKNALIFDRLDKIEIKQLGYDKNFNKVFDALENHKPKQGIFFDGQIFDAHKFVSDLINSAKKKIILIDNYVDYNTLLLFSELDNVEFTIYTKEITDKLRLDLKKFNGQYFEIKVNVFDKSHDRFLIIDCEVYHFGASLKDLGKKWFAFSKLEIDSLCLLNKL